MRGPVFEKDAIESSQMLSNMVQEKWQPAKPPRSPSKSVKAETVITSGKAAGMNVDASENEFPAATTYVMPAPTERQIASRNPPSVQLPTDPTSPRLMFT